MAARYLFDLRTGQETAAAAALQAWVEHDLVERFSGRILELDLEIALIWGRLQGEAKTKGEKLPAIDA